MSMTDNDRVFPSGYSYQFFAGEERTVTRGPFPETAQLIDDRAGQGVAGQRPGDRHGHGEDQHDCGRTANSRA